MTANQKTIAVFFGGRSPEHDVSVVTGLQVLQAIDTETFKAFPVYVTREGRWLTGDVLRDRANYMPDAYTLARATEVTLDVLPTGRPALMPKKPGLLGSRRPVEFDVAMPAFHGLYGEDGQIQGMFEAAGVPYTGPRTLASSVWMDKEATKHICRSLGIPVLPCTILRRPVEGYLIPEDQISELLGDMPWPVIVKPCHLGSSIGVAKAHNAEEVSASLPTIFEYDTSAIVEPCVPHLVEYNVSVSRASGGISTSAIERPKSSAELLDFKEKYLSGGGTKGAGGTKSPGEQSEGMLSLTREINPAMETGMEQNIRYWAETLFLALDGTGAPRIDYLCNSKTGELWLNEVNPQPGSFAYFLWEAASSPVLFTRLLTFLVDEALARKETLYLPADPVPMDARLFQRR
ncbi:MAG: D-alanine--D-alanine ligase [Alphaproteobacteria bacterium]|nr:D-alanine--D-alanine ligase [Alphaproteobacteria bacterium]